MWGRMTMTGGGRGLSRPGRSLRKLAADRKGVAALEFAIVMPLLMVMYFATIEISQGIETNKKLGRAASMIADLVAQQQVTTAGQLEEIMDVGKAVLKPYGRSDAKFTVTAIEITDETTPKVKVAWSKASATAQAPCVAAVVGAAPALPPKLVVRGTYLIRVQACLDYEPVIIWAASSEREYGLGILNVIFDNGVLKMSETYYLRPRVTPTIPCGNC